MKKLVTTIVALLLICTVWCTASQTAHAGTADWRFTGQDCTSNSSAASTINYIRAKYDHGSIYKGTGQCWGWAEKVGNMLAAERSTKYYSNLKFNKKNFRKKCLNIKAGAHIRLSDHKEFNGASGHSICLLKVTDKLVCWTDNNYVATETITYRSGTLEDFVRAYGQYDYFNALTKTVRYKAQSEPLLAVDKTPDGRTKLFWTKTKSTDKYKVYRSKTKNGTYKLIKTTTAKSYKDTTAAYGTKYYYKVRAVKSGTDLYSNPSYGTAKLYAPTITALDNDLKKTGLKLTWTKVTGAKKYYIYRSHNGSSKYKFIASTKKTTYTDYSPRNFDALYTYKVKAVYAKNSKGNSKLSDPSYEMYLRLSAPKVTYTLDEENKTLTMSWKKVPYAQRYAIWSDPENDNSIHSFGYTTELTYTIDFTECSWNGPHEFYIVAMSDDASRSIDSNSFTFDIPEEWFPGILLEDGSWIVFE